MFSSGLPALLQMVQLRVLQSEKPLCHQMPQNNWFRLPTPAVHCLQAPQEASCV